MLSNLAFTIDLCSKYTIGCSGEHLQGAILTSTPPIFMICLLEIFLDVLLISRKDEQNAKREIGASSSYVYESCL